MNCLCIECFGKTLVIDCGISFPHSDLGIDSYYPNFSFLESRHNSIAGVVLTHAHEDHIGGLPYLFRVADVPVFGSPHALALAAERLADKGVDPRLLRQKPFTPGRPFQVGPFEVEPVRVSHSIPDACAIAVSCGGTTIVHTGDFKFDPDPPDGAKTNEARLREIGEQGVDLLLSDSTHIDSEGESGSERSVGRALADIISGCDTRVVVGMFSSNVHRLRMVGEIARDQGRTITLLGRSAQTQTRVAMQCNQIDWPSCLLTPPDSLASLDRRRTLIIAGGTQGEPYAALARLALHNHPSVQLTPRDLVLLSSRIIPGNDPSVLTMVDNFLRQGVRVESRSTIPSLHVSGHAHRSELQRMIELLRPKSFVPIHGTIHHLHRHAQFARNLGVPDVGLAENGDIFELGPTGLRKLGHTEVGKVATYYGQEIPDCVLTQRSQLGRQGVAALVVSVDTQGNLLRPPSLRCLGILDETERADVMACAVDSITKILSRKPYTTEIPTDQQIIDVAERAVQRCFDGFSSRKPITMVQVIRA